MASKQPERRLIHKDRFGYVFGSLKTQNYQDPAARGPGSHTFVYPKRKKATYLAYRNTLKKR